MSSTESRAPVQATPTPPVFSYAQAAKGRATASAASVASTSQTSQATSGISTPAKDANSAVHTPSASVNGANSGSEGAGKATNGSYDAVTKSDPLGLGMDSESKSSTLINSGSSPASPSFGTASTSTLPKEEDLTVSGSAQSDSVWDRHTQSANGTDKSAEAPEGRKGKKGKKQKTAEKDAEKEKEEEKKPEVLVAAPPPAVNIWQQRKEAQALKVKSSPPIVQNSQAFENGAVQPADPKRRGKASGPDDGDKGLDATVNGVAKEPSTNKGQKKGSDGISKGKEDASIKRAGPRGSRVSDREEKAAASQLPPPVEDAMSWPTPETALEEEKRKAQEKEKSEKEKDERDDNVASNKPRPKEKWVPVPYVPSVNFNTPLPPRGGRGRGGARMGRDTTGRGITGEKANNGSTAGPAGDPENRGRGMSTAPRATSLPPNSAKRPSSDIRSQGKSPAIPTNDKSKPGQTNLPAKNQSSSNSDARRTSTADQASEDHQSARGDNPKGFNADHAQAASNENGPRSAAADRKGEQGNQFKEGANFNKDNSQRADGRGDRGRGGFRGRGGHNGFANGQQHPQHAFTNGHGPQPNGFAVRQNSNPYSPSMQQTAFGNPYTQAPARGGRGGSRSQSIPNNGIYGRFPNGAQQIAPLQTQGMYEYPPLQTMSAVPYLSYVDQFPLLAMVTMQLDYYFSIDNLCKDVFLRKHMDSQGFVFLAFIAGFKRIQALTQDLDMLRYACQESENIDIIKGEDGIDRIRRKEGWEKWVLSMEERDESVRNAGPSYHQRQQLHQRPQHMGSMLMPGAHAISPPAFSPNGMESSFRPYGNGAPVAPVNGNTYHPETPLSAAVPDFSPGALPLNGTTDPLDEETTFFDEEIANLKLVFASPKGNENSKARPAYHNASSRTFSNGSIDVRSIAEEIHDDSRQGRGLANGSRASET